MKRYTLENKPSFRNGDKVTVDFSTMVHDGPLVVGTIVGQSSNNIFDSWLVDFGKPINEIIPAAVNYRFPVLNVQHTFIVDHS